jgi:SAM-dependent methyltransferase
VEAARNQILVHHGPLDDVVFLIATIEHVDDPLGQLERKLRLLKPGGRVVIVPDNMSSLDFRLFQGRHWGGYHFPRHWDLFNPSNLRLPAERSEFEVRSLDTLVSPVNWVTQSQCARGFRRALLVGGAAQFEG